MRKIQQNCIMLVLLNVCMRLNVGMGNLQLQKLFTHNQANYYMFKKFKILLMIFVNICDKMPKLAENCSNLGQNIS